MTKTTKMKMLVRVNQYVIIILNLRTSDKKKILNFKKNVMLLQNEIASKFKTIKNESLIQNKIVEEKIKMPI